LLIAASSGGGAGYDDVDTEWMASEGAYYCNTPTAISVSTANGALMLILAATRAISQGDFYTRAGKWRGDASVPGDFFPLGQDIEGMTLGIIGLGSIGKALAVRAQACGMKIIYHNRHRVPESGKAMPLFFMKLNNTYDGRRKWSKICFDGRVACDFGRHFCKLPTHSRNATSTRACRIY
jgi:lactate dehydrogenase-like 2-hydroxyacid dehydrogenase